MQNEAYLRYRRANPYVIIKYHVPGIVYARCRSWLEAKSVIANHNLKLVSHDGATVIVDDQPILSAHEINKVQIKCPQKPELAFNTP